MVIQGKIISRYHLLILAVAIAPSPLRAQWWTAAPADFEECAERAEKSGAANEIKATRRADCETKFAARRKPGGGYTYYDFMQNHSFDIAGPNPTPGEQKTIDEHYTAYLDDHRHSIIVAAFAEKQRQQQTAALELQTQPTSVALPNPKPFVVTKPRPRPKAANCTAELLACGWSKLSSGISDLKKALFGTPSSKFKRT